MANNYPGCTQFKFNTNIVPIVDSANKKSAVKSVSFKKALSIKRQLIRVSCSYYRAHAHECMNNLNESHKCFAPEKCKHVNDT